MADEAWDRRAGTITEPAEGERATGALPGRPAARPQRSARRRFIALLMGAALGVLSAPLWALAPRDAIDPSHSSTVLVGLLVAVPLNVVLHELGHLVAAFALRLRPSALRLFGRTVWRRGGGPTINRSNCVLVRPSRDGRHLPLRMTVFALAGPAVNLLTAVALYLLVRHSATPSSWPAAAFSIALVAALLGAANLWPAGRNPCAAMRDGRQAYLWIRHPQAQYDRLFVLPDLLRAAHGPARAAGEGDRRPDHLRVIAAGREPVARAQAGVQLLDAVVAEFNNGSRNLLHSETPVLIEVAQDPTVHPTAAAEIAGRLAHLYALDATLAQLARQSYESEADRAVQLAELARDRQPEHPFARLSLGMARGLQNRYEESRRILSDLPGDSRMRAEHAAFLTLVEASVGDIEAAQRWAEQAMTLHPTLDTARLADHIVRAVRATMSSH